VISSFFYPGEQAVDGLSCCLLTIATVFLDMDHDILMNVNIMGE
jgi:hypothetical protein